MKRFFRLDRLEAAATPIAAAATTAAQGAAATTNAATAALTAAAECPLTPALLVFSLWSIALIV